MGGAAYPWAGAVVGAGVFWSRTYFRRQLVEAAAKGVGLPFFHTGRSDSNLADARGKVLPLCFRHYVVVAGPESIQARV